MSLENNITKLEDGRLVLNMGPSHPAMHGIVRIILTVEGERVVNSEVEIGYLHRGFEKTCENSNYNQIIPYTDRLNYVSPFINEVGFVMAVEKMMGVELPERAKYIRVIMSEISRMTDHLTCIAANAMELGAFTPYFYLINARELLYQSGDMASGGRVTPNYFRIGGTSFDLTPDFIEFTKNALKKVDSYLSDTRKLLERNRIFYDRLKDTGKITREDAVSYGFTGPLIRSVGIDYDVRKYSPYLVYDRFDFEIPVADGGDNYARFLVRMEEINQSRKIIEQALLQLPDGPIDVDDYSVRLPQKDEVYGSIEGLISHFKLTFEGPKTPKGEIYFAVEGANGELGYYIVSDGTHKPWRVKVRPPCFPVTGALPRLINGGYIADIVATFGQINMIGGELER
ncbi:MAG: NADH-quinone oxidoreductase subunit D [Elusimicrobiales bacterium]|jgi:NADH-quinone oxidoreductase subunit D|nr:NADH-quinone oxidoreductase subunit D [Elusimicrobiales bacterium]NLH39716.1 NADH-quinone oxidoreductase subunit D [Elusimicrobiota bacterium]